MGNITFHNIGAFLHHKRRKEETIILTNVTAPPRDYYVILTHSHRLPAFPAKASLLISELLHGQHAPLGSMRLSHTGKLQNQ